LAFNLSDSSVAVMGAGAVGSYFGGMLARAGARVTLIGRAQHVEAIRKDGLLLDTVTFKEYVAMNASADPADVRDAQVILFCVKTLDTENAARAIVPHLSPDAIVISLQNGVDNVARIRAASGIDALPAVVYVAAALPEPGHVKHSGRGEWIVGEYADAAPPSAGAKSRPERAAENMCGSRRPLPHLKQYRSGPVDKNGDELRWKRRYRDRANQLRPRGVQPRYAGSAANSNQ
jgi:2-dehydropantoate 2-reductase